MIKISHFITVLAFALFFVHPGNSQSVPLNGIINRYAAVLSYDSCAGLMTVTDTAGFVPQSEVLVLHIQGAQINTSNNAQFGTVTNIQQTGHYEFAMIGSRTSTTVTIKNRLQYPILPNESVQLVSFPVFDNAEVTDTIKPLPWDGQKGGVVAFRVNGTLTLNAPVIADGMGFRGGVSYLAPVNNCTWLLGESGYYYGLGNWRGGTKGEGVAPGQSGFELGRGAMANGGGGGNDHNSGGGGGSNTANGGQGGDNNEPSAFGCDGHFPGTGGKGLPATPDRIFMGGGGGAGHTNNGLSSDGGNGGGIIFIEASDIAGLNPKISANGTPADLADGDGAGGGGAGGSIWLKANTISPGAIVRANGGNGGNTSNANANRCFGPGGGGGGGRILTGLISGNLLVQQGIAGSVMLSTNGCNGSTSGALAGQTGIVQPISPIPTGVISVTPPVVSGQPVAQTVCSGESVTFSWPIEPASSSVQWQTLTNSVWGNIPGATTNTLSIPVVSATDDGRQYRCVINGGACYFLVSDVVTLNVVPLPVPGFTTSSNSQGTFFFNNESQHTTGWAWDFGDGTGSMEENPVHTYVGNGTFEVALTAWNSCDTVIYHQEISVALPPVAAFEVADTISACGMVNVQFVNNSTGAQDFQWSFPGGTPSFSNAANPSVSYPASGNYAATLIASNANGSSTLAYSFYVQQLVFPVADFTVQNLNNGNAVQFTFSGSNALFYTWDFGDGSPVSNDMNPIHLYAFPGSFTINLTVQNACGASVLEEAIVVDDESSATTDLTNMDGQYLVVWPNPVSDLLYISAKTGDDRLEIMDITGALIRDIKMPISGRLTIDVKAFPAATYILNSGNAQTRFIKY